jgi:hypothetical protein
MAQQRTTPTRPAARPTARQSATTARTQRRPAAGGARPFQMPFENKNITIILAGVAFIMLGYYLMSISETMGTLALDIAPIILVIGYIIVIPYGIMYGAKRLVRKPVPEPEQINTPL